jgi:3-hydroxymyristoyl/3-hydroxydecanoyl-(acyl carrier protein) dehydratase
MEPFEERSSTGDGTEIRVLSFLVPPDLLYFRGHFDGDPVLPAVVQLDGLVLRQIERVWPELGAPRQGHRLKFKRPVRPGERLELRLSLEPSKLAVTFDIESGAVPCASGTLLFGPIGRSP